MTGFAFEGCYDCLAVSYRVDYSVQQVNPSCGHSDFSLLYVNL